MSRNELETQALGWIADGLAGSDPRLAAMLSIFSRLAAGEEMPAREEVPARGKMPARGRMPVRGRRLGQPQALLVLWVLWVVITAGLIAAALVLNAG